MGKLEIEIVEENLWKSHPVISHLVDMGERCRINRLNVVGEKQLLRLADKVQYITFEI